MKLLSCIIPFVKDAAKSVKRIRQEDLNEVVENTLTKLLGIATLVVRTYTVWRKGDHEVLHLWSAHREEIALCAHCGALSTACHQEEHRCIRHLDVGGKRRFCISWLADFHVNTVNTIVAAPSAHHRLSSVKSMMPAPMEIPMSATLKAGQW